MTDASDHHLHEGVMTDFLEEEVVEVAHPFLIDVKTIITHDQLVLLLHLDTAVAVTPETHFTPVVAMLHLLPRPLHQHETGTMILDVTVAGTAALITVTGFQVPAPCTINLAVVVAETACRLHLLQAEMSLGATGHRQATRVAIPETEKDTQATWLVVCHETVFIIMVEIIIPVAQKTQ